MENKVRNYFFGNWIGALINTLRSLENHGCVVKRGTIKTPDYLQFLLLLVFLVKLQMGEKYKTFHVTNLSKKHQPHMHLHQQYMSTFSFFYQFLKQINLYRDFPIFE